MSIRDWLSRRRTIPAKTHGLSPSDIAASAVDAIKKLQADGREAYVVGGAVRDLLLGFHPKDFDIATDATPDEVRALFGRKSRIIGRRFRIVHVYYYPPRRRGQKRPPREILEVATFRAGRAAADSARRDECFGRIDEDAIRRDFTINALFYDPVSGNVVDYVGGYNDLQKQKIKSIGDDEERLVEDPVRMLRAIRMAKKLGLTIESKLAKLFPKHAGLLGDIPVSRLFDELVKVCLSGAGARILREWQENNIAAATLPHLTEDNPFFFSVMAESDRRFAEERPVSITFLVAALFWRHISRQWYARRLAGEPPQQAMETTLSESRAFSQNPIIPYRIARLAKKLYSLQAQMAERPTAKSARRIMRHEYFDRALAFAGMQQNLDTAQVASWWAQFSRADEREKNRMLNIVAAQARAGGKRKAKPRRRKK